MSFDMTKFERGQVWFISIKNRDAFVGHEQKKDRPWLILSDRKLHISGGMLTAVPVTTRSNERTPSQVCFLNDKSERNCILCEQIRSFDITQYSFTYMGTLSQDIMSQVDAALMFHLGLKGTSTDMDLLLESVSAIVDKIIAAKKADLSPKFNDDDVLNFLSKLQEAADVSISVQSSDTKPVVQHSAEVLKPKNAEIGLEEKTKVPPKGSGTTWILPADEPEETKKEEKKRKNIQWTEELAQKFVDDANAYPMIEVMKRWNISKKPRFYSMKKYAESLLSKTITRRR